MTDDILARLRLEKRELTWRAADEIQRLRTEVERLTWERDEARSEERRKWVKALLQVLPAENAVIFREICLARDALKETDQ